MDTYFNELESYIDKTISKKKDAAASDIKEEVDQHMSNLERNTKKEKTNDT